MIKKVQVIRTGTLVEGTPRITIDLLDGKGKDIGEATDLIGEEVTMILCRTAELPDVIQEVANQLIAAANG